MDWPLYGGHLWSFPYRGKKNWKTSGCGTGWQDFKQHNLLHALMCKKERRTEKRATTVTAVTIKFVFCPCCVCMRFFVYSFFSPLNHRMTILLLLQRCLQCNGFAQRTAITCTYVTIVLIYTYIYLWKLNRNQIKTHG